MPVDKMFTEPMLGPFRDMLKDVETRKLSGEGVNLMRECFGKMEQYAAEMSDFAAFSGRLAQEQLFQKFSDGYSRALSAGAQATQSAQPTDDELMAQTLSAYEQSLNSYRSGQAGESAKQLIPVMDRILTLGRSGITYPVFLRKMEEEGLSKALEGSAPLVRDGLVQDVEFARQAWLPRQVEKTEQKLELFERLAAQAPFGQPQPIEFEMGCVRIDWESEPREILWDETSRRWQKLLEMLVDWVDSFASFAPRDERWMPMGGGDPWPNIMRTRECQPGDLKVRERILEKYFGITWPGFFEHETFLYEFTANRVAWSDERLQLIWDTYPHCVPGGAPPAELVKRAEELYRIKDLRSDRFQAPAWGTPLKGFVPASVVR